jgi:hypothetical protein
MVSLVVLRGPAMERVAAAAGPAAEASLFFIKEQEHSLVVLPVLLVVVQGERVLVPGVPVEQALSKRYRWYNDCFTQ